MMDDRRGVSTPVSYTLTLSIALVLVSGLLIGGTTLVDDQRDRTIRSQMATVGEQVAGSFETADRLAASGNGDPGELRLIRKLPDDILGSGYQVRIYDDPRIDIDSVSADITVSIEPDVDLDLKNGQSVPGGRIVIEYDSSSDELGFQNA